ncbi:MAG: hypothetical protein AB8G05_06050 [Oligoflexales bacterium]
MFRKLAEDANEQNSHIGAFIAKVEEKQYAKIKGNITEMENRFGRTIFGEETWDSLDSKQITNCGCMGELIIESGDLYRLASKNVEHLTSTVLSISKKSYASIGEQLEIFLQNWGYSSRQSDILDKQGTQKNNLKLPYSFLAYRIFKQPKRAP